MRNSTSGFVRPSVGLFVGPSIGPLIRQAPVSDAVVVIACVVGGVGVRLWVGCPCPPFRNDPASLVISDLIQ